MSKLTTYTKTVFVIIAIFAFSLAFAADESIKIEADSMKYYGDKQMSSFKGRVVVSQKGMTMKSDTMDVFFDGKKEVKEILSIGNVKIERGNILALSNKARFFNKDQKLVLEGNARVWQGENYLEGERVTLFNDSERLYVDKGEDKRVKIIITPKEENPKVGTKGR